MNLEGRFAQGNLGMEKMNLEGRFCSRNFFDPIGLTAPSLRQRPVHRNTTTPQDAENRKIQCHLRIGREKMNLEGRFAQGNLGREKMNLKEDFAQGILRILV